MINPGDLVKEFILRIWDDITLWRYRRQYAKLTESLHHLITSRKLLAKKIRNIEAYYELQEGK